MSFFNPFDDNGPQKTPSRAAALDGAEPGIVLALPPNSTMNTGNPCYTLPPGQRATGAKQEMLEGMENPCLTPNAHYKEWSLSSFSMPNNPVFESATTQLLPEGTRARLWCLMFPWPSAATILPKLMTPTGRPAQENSTHPSVQLKDIAN